MQTSDIKNPVSTVKVSVVPAIAGKRVVVYGIDAAEVAGAAEILNLFSGTTAKKHYNLAALANLNIHNDEKPVLICNPGEALQAALESNGDVDLSVDYEYR